VGARLDRELDIVEDARGADLHVDRDFPVSRLAQLLDLDGQVVGASPVGMATRRALVDAVGQVAHPGDALADLLSEQHPAAARLRPLTAAPAARVSLRRVAGIEAIA